MTATKILCLLLCVFLMLALFAACNPPTHTKPPSAEQAPSISSPLDTPVASEDDGDANDAEDGDNTDDGDDDGTPDTKPDTPAKLTEHTFTYGQTTLGYLLYTPKSATADMPMIVYLHGGSGKGSDLPLLTANEGFPKYLKDGRLGEPAAFVLIPQLPSSYKGWESVKDTLIALIDQISNTNNIDAHRISLTGHSMGGTGVFSIAIAYPERFSRIAPLSGSIKSTQANLSALSSVSIRAFVGSADTVVDPDSTVSFINALKAVNASSSVTVIPNATHTQVPALVYLSQAHQLIAWLIA